MICTVPYVPPLSLIVKLAKAVPCPTSLVNVVTPESSIVKACGPSRVSANVTPAPVKVTGTALVKDTRSP